MLTSAERTENHGYTFRWHSRGESANSGEYSALEAPGNTLLALGSGECQAATAGSCSRSARPADRRAATAVKGSQGVLFVHDLTREDTRRSMEEYWMPMVWRLVGKIPMVIVGNKVDLLEDERVSSHEYTYYLQEKYDSPAIMTSAKTGESAENSFKVLGEMIVESAGIAIERLALVTPPQEPVDLLIRVADKIMTDFCYQLGSVDAGMPVVKRQFERAGVDVRAPSPVALRKAIEFLAGVEKDFKNENEIATNRERRLAWLEGREIV